MWNVIAAVVGHCRACGADLSCETRLRATEDWADRYHYDEHLRRKVDRAVVRQVIERHVSVCRAAMRPGSREMDDARGSQRRARRQPGRATA